MKCTTTCLRYVEILLFQSSVCPIHVSNSLFQFDALYNQDYRQNNEIIYIDPLLTISFLKHMLEREIFLKHAYHRE